MRRRWAGSIVVIDCAVIVLNCRGNATALINEPPIITKRSSFLQRCNYNALPLHPQSHCFLLRHRHAHSPQPCRFGSGLPLLTAAPPLRAARARATVVWWVVHLRASQRVAVQAALAWVVVAQRAAHWHAARWRTALPGVQRLHAQCGGTLRMRCAARCVMCRCCSLLSLCCLARCAFISHASLRPWRVGTSAYTLRASGSVRCPWRVASLLLSSGPPSSAPLISCHSERGVA